MLPDCSQLPEWAHWIAQDGDGSWWAYQHEPNMADSGWYENELGQSLHMRKDMPNPFWRQEIHNIEKSNQ